MDDAARVGVGQPFGDFGSVAQRVVQLGDAAHKDVAERFSLDELHDDHRRGAGLEELVDLADIGVIE